MQGTTGSTFSPDRASNRGMIAAILYRLEGRPRAGTPPFTDVAADSYCADAVAWAEQQGIVRLDGRTFSARRGGSPASSGGHPVPVHGIQGSGYRGPDGPEPLLRQRRCGGLCPGGPGLGGVCRTAPGPVRRHAGSVRLRHARPDGSDPPAAGNTAGKELNRVPQGRDTLSRPCMRPLIDGPSRSRYDGTNKIDRQRRGSDSMKVCILMGSPRKIGQYQRPAGPFRQELEGLGAETETVWLHALRSRLHGLPGLPAGRDGIRLRSAGRRAHDL